VQQQIFYDDARRSGESPSQLTIEQQTAAVPTDAIPQVIADKARELGFELDSALWAKLDYVFHNVIHKFGEQPFLRIALGGQLVDLSPLVHLECDH
jgi:hypothetical protein